MTGAFTFKEISEVVDAIPANQWCHTFSGDAEHLEFRMANQDLLICLQANNRGVRTGMAPITLKSVSVELGYVNAQPIAEYKGTIEVRELFYETRVRVREHCNLKKDQTVKEQLREFGVRSYLVDKILNAAEI